MYVASYSRNINVTVGVSMEVAVGLAPIFPWTSATTMMTKANNHISEVSNIILTSSHEC